MVTAAPVNISSITIDDFIRLTAWNVPSPMYRQNMRLALDYFRRAVDDKRVLLQPEESAPWVPQIQGVATKLASWMQGIDFNAAVYASHPIPKGTLLYAYKPKSFVKGRVGGNWFITDPQQKSVAIHSTQTALHKFRATRMFTCLKSSASDAHVAWLPDLPPEYRRGGSSQLFIWKSEHVLECA